MAEELSLEKRLASLTPDVRARVEAVLIRTLENELASLASAERGHDRSHDRSHSRTAVEEVPEATSPEAVS